MTDKLLGAFLAARRLPPHEQDELGERIASEVAASEGNRYAELSAWAFPDRRVNPSGQREAERRSA